MSPVAVCRALANEQDLYVVAADPSIDLDGLAAFRRGVWGWVDRRSLSSEGDLYLEGWAASLDEGSASRIEIVVDGEAHDVEPSIDRPDVGEAHRDARLVRSGWRLQTRLRDAGRSSVPVEVFAHTATSCSLLYKGDVRSV